MEVVERTYDETVDAAYFRFSRNQIAKTVELDDEMLRDYYFDLDDDGVLVGVEVLSYSDTRMNLGRSWMYITIFLSIRAFIYTSPTS